MDTIGGFFVGVLLFFVTFGVPYCAAHTEKDSKDIAKLSEISVEQAAGHSGAALVQGTVKPGQVIEPPMGEGDGDLLAYRYTLERYDTWTETREETHTETRGGQDIEVTEEVTEEVSDWRVQDEEERWATVLLGAIEIDPKSCDLRLPWDRVYYDEYTEELSGQQYRETVEVVRGGVAVLLAAELHGGRVADEPDFYVLTTQSKDELVGSLHKAEETQRWMLIALSVILWTASFSLMIGPAMLLINIIPIKELTTAVRGVITFISLVLACLLTFITYVFYRYWWVFVILILALAVWLVVEANRGRKAATDAELET